MFKFVQLHLFHFCINMLKACLFLTTNYDFYMRSCYMSETDEPTYTVNIQIIYVFSGAVTKKLNNLRL